jgi:hypothetical protein
MTKNKNDKYLQEQHHKLYPQQPVAVTPVPGALYGSEATKPTPQQRKC